MTVGGVPAWLHESTSLVSLSPVRNGPVPGNWPESRVWRPVPSEASICSTLHGVVSVQGLPSMSAGVQVDGPPAGSVEVTTWPFVSPATHSDTDGHAIEFSHRPSSIVALFQLPAAGFGRARERAGLADRDAQGGRWAGNALEISSDQRSLPHGRLGSVAVKT